MKSANQIIKEIRYWINQYHEHRGTNDIEKILNIQDEIAIRTYTLASHVADWKTSFNAKYFIRKIGVAKTSINYQKAGLKQGQSDSQALIDNADAYEIEQSHEATAVTLDILLKQTNIILQVIAQRISYMKQEKAQTQRQNNT